MTVNPEKKNFHEKKIKIEIVEFSLDCMEWRKIKIKYKKSVKFQSRRFWTETFFGFVLVGFLLSFRCFYSRLSIYQFDSCDSSKQFIISDFFFTVNFHFFFFNFFVVHRIEWICGRCVCVYIVLLCDRQKFWILNFWQTDETKITR